MSVLTEAMPVFVLLVGFVMGFVVMKESGLDFTTENFLFVTGVTCLSVGLSIGSEGLGGWLDLLGVLCIAGGSVMKYRRGGG